MIPHYAREVYASHGIVALARRLETSRDDKFERTDRFTGQPGAGPRHDSEASSYAWQLDGRNWQLLQDVAYTAVTQERHYIRP